MGAARDRSWAAARNGAGFAVRYASQGSRQKRRDVERARPPESDTTKERERLRRLDARNFHVLKHTATNAFE